VLRASSNDPKVRDFHLAKEFLLQNGGPFWVRFVVVLDPGVG
jgi:hypothetical protein